MLDISLQQSLIHIPMNDPSAPLPYTQANDSIGAAPIIANTTLSNTTVPSVQAIKQTIPIPQADQLIWLSRPGGGIFCANVGCTSKGGNRTQGHAECSDLLCNKCCHNTTILAQQLRIDRLPCQECWHRLANAGAPVPNPPQNISAVAAGPAPAPPVVPAMGPQPIAAPSTAMIESTPQLSTPEPTQAALSHPFLMGQPAWGTPVQSQSDYAMPLATMWQPATPAWLKSRGEAAKEDDQRAQGKKAVITLQQMKRIQITTISWIKVSHSNSLHSHLGSALILGETWKHYPTSNH